MNNTTTPGQTPQLAIDGRVATITLRRPAVANRLELEDLQTLQAQIEKVERKPRRAGAATVAEGRHFCSGFNIGQVRQRRQRCRPTLRSLAAALDGAAGDDRGDPGRRLRRCDRPRARLRLSHRHAGVGAQRAGGEAGLAVLPRRTGTVGDPAGPGHRQARAADGDKLDADAMLSCGYLDRLAPSVEALQPLLDELTPRSPAWRRSRCWA